MRPVLLAVALLPLCLAPDLAAAKAGAKAGKSAKKAEKEAEAPPAPKDPFEGWIESETLARDGKLSEAVKALRVALDGIRAIDEKAEPPTMVTGPKGASWTKAEALYHYNLRAGEFASRVDYREAAGFYEAAMAAATSKDDRKNAKFKAQAARDNLAAGVKKAPAFMGDDDFTELADEAKAAREEAAATAADPNGAAERREKGSRKQRELDAELGGSEGR